MQGDVVVGGIALLLGTELSQVGNAEVSNSCDHGVIRSSVAEVSHFRPHSGQLRQRDGSGV